MDHKLDPLEWNVLQDLEVVLEVRVKFILPCNVNYLTSPPQTQKSQPRLNRACAERPCRCLVVPSHHSKCFWLSGSSYPRHLPIHNSHHSSPQDLSGPNITTTISTAAKLISLQWVSIHTCTIFTDYLTLLESCWPVYLNVVGWVALGGQCDHDCQGRYPPEGESITSTQYGCYKF